MARVPNSALSLSQHQDEDASENAQKEALKKERPGGNLLRKWRSSLWAPPCTTAAMGPNSSPPVGYSPSTSAGDMVGPFSPGCPTIVQIPDRNPVC